MDKALHEKALEEALDVILDVHRAGTDTVARAIAAYLKTAGLTVVPVNPTREMIYAKAGTASCDIGVFNRAQFKAMLSAFSSPFKDIP